MDCGTGLWRRGQNTTCKQCLFLKFEVRAQVLNPMADFTRNVTFLTLTTFPCSPVVLYASHRASTMQVSSVCVETNSSREWQAIFLQFVVLYLGRQRTNHWADSTKNLTLLTPPPPPVRLWFCTPLTERQPCGCRPFASKRILVGSSRHFSAICGFVFRTTAHKPLGRFY